MALDHLGRFDFRSSSDCWQNGCEKVEQLVVVAESSHEREVLTLDQYELRFDWVDVESDANVGRLRKVQSECQNGYAHVHGPP